MFRNSRRLNGRTNFQGMSLPIVLMFLLVISLLASVGIRRATLGEAMSRNQIELETARQAAEAALRDAERDLLDGTGSIKTNAICSRGSERPMSNKLTKFNSDCSRGQCFLGLNDYYRDTKYQQSTSDATPTNAHAWWPTTNGKNGKWNNDFSNKPTTAVGINCTFNGAVPLGTFTGTPRIAAVARQPEYIIEVLKLPSDTIMRITARGFGTDQNTEVVMQTYFRPFEQNGTGGN